MRKRQIFYFALDVDGMYRVYEGRIVQARVIAVAEKVIRVEVFGVECSILARDLAWDWIGDAHERFSVGDEVLVRILSVQRRSLEDLSIRADIKSTAENTDRGQTAEMLYPGASTLARSPMSIRASSMSGLLTVSMR